MIRLRPISAVASEHRGPDMTAAETSASADRFKLKMSTSLGTGAKPAAAATAKPAAKGKKKVRFIT